MKEINNKESEKELSDFRKIRYQKLENLRSMNIDPFGGEEKYDITIGIGKLKEEFKNEVEVTIAGRITAKRDMGKSHFLNLSEASGTIQLFINKKQIGNKEWEIYENIDIGDWIGIEGQTFTTRVGEPSVQVNKLKVLSKSLMSIPSNWHGVNDPQIRYRQRYLDLISNDHSRDIFIKRSQIISEIRRYLEDREFLEVETRMLQDIPGGASAEPFKTKHKALSMDMYLRIAPELYLKRMLIGGFTKVFELNRNFRNEGISRRHNPEFTMLEAYCAFSDFTDMSNLVEDLICHLATKFFGGLKIEHKDKKGNVKKMINLSRPWRRESYKNLIKEVAGDNWWNLNESDKKNKCKELNVEISPNMKDHQISQQVFEKLVEEKSIDPLFVTHVSEELVPLAKKNKIDNSVVDVYELIINGAEISPGYSELNDPEEQKSRLMLQAQDEDQKLDNDFITALEYGMPPAGGIGIGIDRLIMMLTGAESIRDVILFPQLKSNK